MENTYGLPSDTEAILPPAYYPLPPRRRSQRARETDRASSRPPPQYAFMEDDAFDRRVPTPPPRPRTPRPRRHSDGEGYYGRVTTTDDDDDELSAEAQANLETRFRLARMGSNRLPCINFPQEIPNIASAPPDIHPPSTHSARPPSTYSAVPLAQSQSSPAQPDPRVPTTKRFSASSDERSKSPSRLFARRSIEEIWRSISVRRQLKPSSPPIDFPGHVRWIGDRQIFLLEPEHADLFDQIVDWQNVNPQRSMGECLDQFAPSTFPLPQFDLSDALTRLVYCDVNLHYDFILRHPASSLVPSQSNIKERRKFEIALLRQGLVVEHEPSLNRDEVYVKVLAPFDTLCRIAQDIRLKRRLQSSLFPPLRITDLVTFTINSLPPPLPKLLGHNVDVNKESAFFKIENLRMFEGAEQGKAWSDIVLNFWDSGKRNMMVYNILINAEIMKHHTQSQRGIGLRHLLHKKVYTAAYTLHDGPYKFKPSSDSHSSSSSSSSSASFAPAMALTGESFVEAKASSEQQQAVNMREWLYRVWVSGWLHTQPLQEVRAYFGEKVAIYFAWLGFYTTWLWLAAPVGLGVFVYGAVMASKSPSAPVSTNVTTSVGNVISGVFDNAATAPFAFFMSVWTTLYLEFWRRRNYVLQWEWDVLQFEKEEQPRPEYYGTTVRISPVTMREELYYPPGLRMTKIAASAVLVGSSILIVLCTVGTLIVFTAWTRGRVSGYWSSVLSAMVNLATIMVLNRIYAKFAVYLTNFENHRTQTMYENALILKHYLFSFINYYSTLFYILIFKQSLGRNLLGQYGLNDECQFGSCMTELTIQLAIIFIGKQAIGQVEEILVPWFLKRRYAKRDNPERRTLERQYAWHYISQHPPRSDGSARVNMIPQWVEDARLPAYDNSIFNEYNEMVIQFGFVSLFVAAFPLAPLLALLNNLLEVRSDAYKLLTTYQRPVAYQAQDIGMWEKILNVVSVVSALTNGAIIAFQSAYMEHLLVGWFGQENLLASRLGFLFVFEHAVLLLKFLLAYLIPDMPTFVKIAIEREDFTARRKIGNPDDEESDSDSDSPPARDSGKAEIEIDAERGNGRSYRRWWKSRTPAAKAKGEEVLLGRREIPERERVERANERRKRRG